MKIESATTTTAAGTTVSPRLHKAATQFEAMLLKDMLKPLTEATTDIDTGEEKEAGPLQGFAVESVADSMARSGALGFAHQIEQTLARAGQQKISQETLKS